MPGMAPVDVLGPPCKNEGSYFKTNVYNCHTNDARRRVSKWRGSCIIYHQ